METPDHRIQELLSYLKHELLCIWNAVENTVAVQDERAADVKREIEVGNTDFDLGKANLDKLVDTVGNLKEEVGNLVETVGSLKEEVGSLVKTVDDLKEEVGKTVGDLKEEVGDLREELNKISTSLANGFDNITRLLNGSISRSTGLAQ